MVWRRTALFAITLAIVGSGAPRLAEAAGPTENIQTATDLLDLCADRQDAAQIACKFYIHGSLQAAQMMHAADQGGQFTPMFCPPETLSTDDFIAKLRLQQAAHPERRTFPAATVIIGGAIDAYPCAKIAAGKAAVATHKRRRARRH